VAVDLKNPQGVEIVLRLIETADVLIEGFRPGVMERLGLGPDICLARNQGLVYGRMTGWGQHGTMAHAAGHDINYISLSGALHAIGEPGGKPVPPLNLVGDFGGGGMLLAFGIAAALVERAASGKGQVVDAAMTDGSALLMNGLFPGMQTGQWLPERGTNMLDGGAHFYDTYQCADGEYVSIGSIEPQFYALLKELAGLSEEEFGDQNNPAKWPALKQRLADVFRSKTRAEWCEIMEGTDVCFAPVLNFVEAPDHPANVARQTYIEVEGVTQPAPAPRFSRTPSEVRHAGHNPGQDTDEVLAAMGFAEQEIARLRESGAIA